MNLFLFLLCFSKIITKFPYIFQYNSINIYILAYFAKDRLNGDPNLGIFGVFDGHGGR